MNISTIKLNILNQFYYLNRRKYSNKSIEELKKMIKEIDSAIEHIILATESISHIIEEISSSTDYINKKDLEECYTKLRTKILDSRIMLVKEKAYISEELAHRTNVKKKDDSK